MTVPQALFLGLALGIFLGIIGYTVADMLVGRYVY